MNLGLLNGVFRSENLNPRPAVVGAVRVLAGVLAVGASLPLGGCLVYKAVTTPVKLAATTVIVAGETAGTVVTTTGKLAMSGVNAVGNVGSGGIDAAAKLTQTGMVTFVDASTGAVVRVPWQEGMTLAGAGGAARIDLARRAVDVVRAGQVIYSATRSMGEGAPLASGDVVRLTGKN